MSDFLQFLHEGHPRHHNRRSAKQCFQERNAEALIKGCHHKIVPIGQERRNVAALTEKFHKIAQCILLDVCFHAQIHGRIVLISAKNHALYGASPVPTPGQGPQKAHLVLLLGHSADIHGHRQILPQPEFPPEPPASGCGREPFRVHRVADADNLFPGNFQRIRHVGLRSGADGNITAAHPACQSFPSFGIPSGIVHRGNHRGGGYQPCQLAHQHRHRAVSMNHIRLFPPDDPGDFPNCGNSVLPRPLAEDAGFDILRSQLRDKPLLRFVPHAVQRRNPHIITLGSNGPA